jgi:hypothetical protein
VLGFTKKKLSHINAKRDPIQRQMWWTLPAPKGVLNVPRDLLIDIEETSVVLYSAKRGFGHDINFENPPNNFNMIHSSFSFM